jgi:hypothetical protein
MNVALVIENIDELRRRNGIDDVELQAAIRRLRVGDRVKLTILVPIASFAGETLVVRITSIRGMKFRGKVVTAPVSRGLKELRVGSSLAFSADHIHSVASQRPAEAKG